MSEEFTIYQMHGACGFYLVEGRWPLVVVEFPVPQHIREFYNDKQERWVCGFRRFGVFYTPNCSRLQITVCTPTPHAMDIRAAHDVWKQVMERVLPILDGEAPLPEGVVNWNEEKKLWNRGEGDYVRVYQPTPSCIPPSAV